ncbi:MAG: 23S rRNA (uracil(1939)-C(5))-methyltransferase RlmD [Ruminococcaceae bacterium]|nr:23S rRNA (uracil(1939)-C(5))-methyltransferase RlmD [Oscillospiraceae bacterium]
MNIKKNDDIRLYIENMTGEGSAVGHCDGVAVFVRGAVTGDEIIAHIIKVSKNYCIGIVKDIIKKSPSRIKSDCPVSARCGGCSFREMTYDEELRFKKSRVVDAVKRIGHLDVPVSDIIGADSTQHYRNKAQYPVSISDGELIAGFYAYKSHRIIPCSDCLLQPSVFSDCLDAFSQWVQQSGVTSYDEESGRGLLRHIYLRRTSLGEIMACAVTNGSSLPKSDLLVDLLKSVEGVKSVCQNINTKKGNVILSGDTKTLWGSDTVADVLLGKRFEISPNSFYQVNHDQCEKLYKKAAEYAQLTGSETLVDLYCGAGTIGITMAENARQIYGIEIVPQAVENARRNAGINGITNAEYICGDANFGAEELERRGVMVDVAVLDPPRKGCSPDLIDTVCRMSPKRIVYVSCDAATLARDLRLFDSAGYKTQQITPVDMFPRTPHTESVCLLCRQRQR